MFRVYVRQGRVGIAFQNLPADIEAVYAGTVLPQEGRSVAFTSGVPISILLRRTEVWTGHIGGVAQTSRISLRIRAERPLLGDQDASIDIVAKIAPARLVYRGYSGDRAGKAPLTIPIVDLQQAGRAFDFTVEDALVPPKPEQFSVSAPGFFGNLLNFGVAGLKLAADSPIERGKEITPIELHWGEVLIDRTGQRKVLTLCENPGDHQPSWSQHFKRR